jgi:anti-sigma B factor antagonist
MSTIVEGELKNQTLHLVVKAPRLNAANARVFKAECLQLLATGIEFFVIDLCNVESLDSSGVGALLSVYKHFPGEPRLVTLQNVKPPVQSVVESFRFHRTLQIQI